MISFIKSAFRPEDYPDSNKEVVFVGRSNVGKSSLINALFGKIAYVGKTPGKTTSLNFFDCDHKFTVCDVPGYGYAKRSFDELIAFGKTMDKYFSFRDCLKLCIIILDIRRVPNEDDLGMVEYCQNMNIPYFFVINKMDKLSFSNQKKSIEEIKSILKAADDQYICVSAEKKTNISELRSAIYEKLS